jgi:hypothetical protein
MYPPPHVTCILLLHSLIGAIGYSQDPNTEFGDLAYLRADKYEANVR